LLFPYRHAHFEPAHGRHENRPFSTASLPLARVPGPPPVETISLLSDRILQSAIRPETTRSSIQLSHLWSRLLPAVLRLYVLHEAS